MSHDYREHLSALMDGELPRDESRFLLKRLERDDALGATWARFHVARQALRRQDIHALRPGFSAGVLACIHAEAVPQRRAGGTWLRWASGGAVAASVAVAALVLTRPAVETVDAGATASPRTMAARSGAPVAAAPASVSTLPQELRTPASSSVLLPVQTASATAGEGDWAQPVASFDPRMQSYLIRHYQAVGAAGQSGVVPYILLATPAQPPAAAPAANDPNPNR
ncbi:sigma-E factor negative regulatory protein [Dokdonella koreensis]|uniref:Negative regulator of sigma E activity n=1 Tax=Dokdonella koreensis DS-123 TaxID=1300342 RepID=A0A167GGE0_9GAMM|nr:sigma-E factor negative regulatory protein [Dokdonella koreensis]ANB16527.1 Negative regulator of sigma E activity [Dokdonella koreensis DS-123]